MQGNQKDEQSLLLKEERDQVTLSCITEILQSIVSLLLNTFPEHSILSSTKYSKLQNCKSLETQVKENSLLKLSKDQKFQLYQSEDLRVQQILNFGLETLQSLQFQDEKDITLIQQSIEAHFKVKILDVSLFRHPETTFNVIAKIILSRGKAPYRPILIDGMDLMNDITKEQGFDNENMFIKSFRTIAVIVSGKRKKRSLSGFFAPSEVMPPKWFEQHQIQANNHTHCFENNIGLKDHSMTRKEKNEHAYYSIQIFGVFFYLPLCLYLLFAYFSWTTIVIVMTLFLIYVYVPDYSEYPPLFRRHQGFIYNIKYFSFKTIIESPITSYENIPSIYTFGPHGVFGIAPCIQALINGYLVGEHFHILGANVVFLFPLYNILLRMMGFDDISRNTFVKLLKKNHSIGIIPGGIGEMFYSGNKIQDEVLMVRNRKGFISIALQTGSQIIPTYCYGSTQMFYVGSSKLLQKLSRLLRTSIILFWGKYGLPIPLKVPMVCVLGTPIRCPKVDNPSKELIDYYHTLYLQETQRLYQTYRNSYGWQDRELVFKG